MSEVKVTGKPVEPRHRPPVLDTDRRSDSPISPPSRSLSLLLLEPPHTTASGSLSHRLSLSMLEISAGSTHHSAAACGGGVVSPLLPERGTGGGLLLGEPPSTSTTAAAGPPCLCRSSADAGRSPVRCLPRESVCVT
ncbi:hypothetical protein HanRHA438_Chr07g0299231 [Helianthus annuus]|nr:hypothetical protein HanIR_Chr07g0311471 [Helianthus annuus]KAJ0907458.1 hypothetical protein HanRHA438_Chr07g0299231 [Helianthus annuus]